MAVTYREEDFGCFTKVKFPVLHRVDYSKSEDPKHFFIIHNWCESNCKAQFYHGPHWSGDFIEFEDDEDAIMFALRWA